ncbi:hypothetical protein C8Q74DRAFT_354363 [Fomes fomentarius]|nr:hypothetical protein C8Q74DRAFT_354363 [Fomes fomentarius]
MHRAIYCYDVLCMILEENLGQNGATLASSVLVCRAWSGPATRFLWRTLPSFQPIWHLFAPPDLPYKLYNTMPWSYVITIASAQLYRDPARWARVLSYSKYIRKIQWPSECRFVKHGEGASCPTLERNNLDMGLLALVLPHNPGGPLFPSLRTFRWTPSSTLDELFLAIVGPQLRHVVLDRACNPSASGAGINASGLPLLVERLRQLSPRLETIRIELSSSETLSHAIVQTIASFDCLRDFSTTMRISLASLFLLASVENITSIKVDDVFVPDEHTTEDRVITATKLHHVTIRGDCDCLVQLFTVLAAPSLRTVNIRMVDETAAVLPSYIAFIDAFSTAAFQSEIERLSIAFEQRSESGIYRKTTLLSILGPLLMFPVRHFELCSDVHRFSATDADFQFIAQTWEDVEVLRMDGIVWLSSDEPDSMLPTAATLHHLWKHCPHLVHLTLPYLSFAPDLPALPRLPPGQKSSHPLTHLRIDFAEWADGADELAFAKFKGLSDYLRALFPALDVNECCEIVHTRTYPQLGWGRVFRWLCREQLLAESEWLSKGRSSARC